MTTEFNHAIQSWKNRLGPNHVSTDEATLFSSATTTFQTNQKICAILYPNTNDDVSACIKIANQYRIPVYPISCGKNWGYGSKIPVETDCVLLDMSRMNRIVEFDEELAYVVVEPGVTQLQLFNFLQEKTQGRIMMDTVASSPHTSLIGNAMERGHGTTPYADRVSHCADVEAVLANGDIIQTGYGMFQECKTHHLDAWGLGPAVSHLFSQSNLGIVTKMSLFLYPRPECIKMGMFSTDHDAEFMTFIDFANQARLKGILKTGPQLANNLVSLTRMLKKHPGHDIDMSTLCKSLGIKKWSAIFGIYGTTEEVTAIQSNIQNELKTIGYLSIFNETDLAQNDQLSNQVKNDLRQFYLQLSGHITGFALSRPYWKCERTMPEFPEDIDLDKDRCGFLSINPVAPFRAEDALSIFEISTKIISSFGFEANITAYGTRPRILQFHITLCFNRDNREEDERALACQSELMNALQSLGYYSFRLNIASMDQFQQGDSRYLNLIKTIKNAIDPNCIIAPGRYGAPSTT